mmetsp:Transcript_22337/g.37367  ORF Transcript_22337/g.37367 Transcript_22337/m.37367 type:complete len:282 (-) Transcript_22337:650-1495(-)
MFDIIDNLAVYWTANLAGNAHLDMLMSAGVGLVISVVIIKFGSGPAIFKIEDGGEDGESNTIGCSTGNLTETSKLTGMQESDPDHRKLNTMNSGTGKDSNDENTQGENKDTNERDETELDDSEPIPKERLKEFLKDDMEVSMPEVNAEHAMKKLAPYQKLLGLTDAQMKEAIDKTNKEIREESQHLYNIRNGGSDTATLAAVEYDWATLASKMLDILILLLGVLFGFMALNTFTKGDFGRMLTAMFPREMESLNLKDYLDNYHNFPNDASSSSRTGINGII